MAQVIKNRIVKTILRIALSLFLLLFIVAGAIQLPYVQTKLVNYLSEKYSTLIGYNMSISNVALRWFDSIEIKGVEIFDPEDNKMIYVRSLFIDFDISSLLDKVDHNVDEINIDEAHVYLTKLYSDNDSLQTLNINDFIKRLRSLGASTTSSSRQYISCDYLTIKNSKFGYNDQLRDSLYDRFDYFHFTIDSIKGDFNNVFVVRDTFGLSVNNLFAKDLKSNLTLKRLNTNFSVSQSSMKFLQLDLLAGNSNLTDSIVFNYNSLLDLSDFNNKVKISSHLNNSILYTDDLSIFAPQLSKMHEKYRISGDINGYIRSFIIENANISMGTGTSVRGKIRMTGLPIIQETFMDFNLTNSYITTSDFKDYMNEKSYNRLKPFEHISFSATFIGYPSDFVARGDFFTEYGRLNSDINLKLKEDINRSTYSGKISMENFDVGGYLDNSLITAVTLNGSIKGTGFTLETADFKLNGEIEKVGIHGYDYENIKTNARFTKEFFEGEISIDDTNLKLALTGAIDLRAGLNFFNLSAQLDTANLKILKITQEDLFIRSNLNVNARGLQIDNILGGANLTDTFIKFRDNSLQIDSMSIISDKDEEQRILFLKTNLLNLKATGEFDFTQVFYSLKNLIAEYQLSLKNDSELIVNYYQKKEESTDNYSLKYEIDIKDLNPLLNVFAPELFVSAASKINGSIVGGYTSIISMDTKLDSISYNGNTFLNTDVQINVSKISDSTNVLAMVFVASEKQILSNVNTKNLLFEGIWDNNHIDFEFDIYQTLFENHALLFGTVDFLPDSTKLKLESSDLTILDKQWNVQKDNLITLSNKEILIENFSIYNGIQKIELNGTFSENPDRKMTLQIDSLDLENLNTIMNKDISGVVNGYAEVKSVYGDILFENNLNIQSLTIDDFLIGNIEASSNWNNLTKESIIKGKIRRLEFDIFELSGKYSPYKENQLNLVVDLNETEIKVIEPFLDDFFTDFRGTLDGKLKITGALEKPLINGDGLIKNAGLHINYLNTDYIINGKFYLTSTKIGFQQLDVIDIDGNHGYVNGYLDHENFRNMGINLTAQINTFQILNTTSKDNTLFYGNGIATGNIEFIGPLKNMSINANARTEKGTRIYIPIGDSENIEKEEYINFVDLDYSLNNIKDEVIKKIDLRGLKLDFDLDITPDAYCEIIFDIKSGDIIRGRGNGDLKLQIDTKGDFNMFGDYNIQQGGYNFTLYNLINKEFEILSNSKISWYGDPYQGILDINANYNQLASLLPLLDPLELGAEINQVVEIKRKYPVYVQLEIDGPLLSPSIDFDITTGALPRNIQVPSGASVDLEFEFLKFKNSIDEQELKRQVFSLIILRKFSPLQSFNTGGSINRSVSELLSNQLSYWITQVDENLEIDVDFGALDQDAFNTFQLRLSYTFLDGRLRVTRDGGFTNQANKADVSSIAGDWTVEYLLTQDGKFKAKMYNKTNYNPINPTGENQNTVTTGFSIIHTQSFDELKDLFKKSRENARKEIDSEEEEPIENDDSSVNKSAVLNEDELD